MLKEKEIKCYNALKTNEFNLDLLYDKLHIKFLFTKVRTIRWTITYIATVYIYIYK